MKSILGLSVLALFVMQGATGCSSYSEDRDTFRSTYMQPKTVVVISRPSNETIWSKPIPPEHVLIVERDDDGFELEAFTTAHASPTKITWELYHIDAPESLLRNGHYWAAPIESGEKTFKGEILIKTTIGDPVDPKDVPKERTIEDIEKDLPEPVLPEPDEKKDDKPAE